MKRLLWFLAVGTLVLVTTGAAYPGKSPAAQSRASNRIVGAAAVAASSFSRTETISRTNITPDGKDDVVDTRTVSVGVSSTKDLRDRQAVTVTWKGAHPTGGTVPDPNDSPSAVRQEYPVMVMQCRGIDSTSVPVSQRISPRTCYTQTPSERLLYSSGENYPPYRMDRYATRAERGPDVDDPNNPACNPLQFPHWVPFVAADGRSYYGGVNACAGLAPEQSKTTDPLQPASTTYGTADLEGNGSAKFIIQTAASNASLGCSATVACSLVVIPIMGISCDPLGDQAAPLGMEPDQRPVAVGADPSDVYASCAAPPSFQPGEPNSGGQEPNHALTGETWWSASNWRNRISVPLTMATSASVCDVVNNQATAYIFGAEGMTQATQQWSPSFCLNPKLFTLSHIQTSEPQAKRLLAAGSIEAAFQAAPPDSAFTTPTVQAPTALSGWAIAYSIDDKSGNPAPTIRLDARLIAKLMSESYRSCAQACLDYTSAASQRSGFARIANNPIDMSRDPEFQALNPTIPTTLNLAAAAALAFMSSDSDVMTAVTTYLNQDPEARAWLDGKPDPWGMVVNPAYQDIQLPVDNWPLRDTHIANTGDANKCLQADPTPWLPLVEAPVTDPATVSLNLQYDIANAQVNCKNNDDITRKLGALGREVPGNRFLVGLVSLADAARYQLSTVQLQTQRTSTNLGTFDDASGRNFVGATTAGLTKAARLMQPDDALGTWPVPYDKFLTAAGRSAYPGVLLMSTDVPTKGVPAADALNYARFLRFVATDGQKQGLANGDLPPGYLPITKADGLGAMAAYTLTASDAVQAQQGVVPYVSGRPQPVTPRTPVTTPPGTTTIPAGSTPTIPAGSTPTGGAPTAAPTSTPSTAPSSAPPSSITAKPVAGAPTQLTRSGPLGLALPVLLIAALLAGGVAAWTGRGRR